MDLQHSYEELVEAFHPDGDELAEIDHDHYVTSGEILDTIDLIRAVHGEHPEGRAGRAADRLRIELNRRIRLGAL